MNNQSIFSQEKLLELYAALPENLKEVIFSVDVAGKISATGKKFGLSIEQTGNLATDTGLVILGALHPRNFILSLEKDLGIEREKAIDVAKEINHEIFFPIRESLKKIHGMEEADEVTSERQMEQGDALQRVVGQRPPATTPPPASNTPTKPAPAMPPPISSPKIIETPPIQKLFTKISDILPKKAETLNQAAAATEPKVIQKPESQKIVMQEIKPRQTPPVQSAGGDTYREPIE